MRSLALINPGPTWTNRRPIFEQERGVVQAHLGAMRDLYDSGVVLFGGPARDGMSGCALFETASLDEARTAMAADPAVVAGIFTFDLVEITPYFDAFDGTRR